MSGTVIIGDRGEGSPYQASFDFEGRYVIRMVDFAPTKMRRDDFLGTEQRNILRWFDVGRYLCGGCAFPDKSLVVVAGTFDRRADAAPAWVREPCLCICNRDGGGNEHPQAS